MILQRFIPNFVKEVANWYYCQVCFQKLLDEPAISKKFAMVDEEGQETTGIGKSFLGVFYVFVKVPEEIYDNEKALDAYINDPLLVLNQFFIEMELMGSMKAKRELIDSGEPGKFVLIKFIPIFKRSSFIKFLLTIAMWGGILYYIYLKLYPVVVHMLP